MSITCLIRRSLVVLFCWYGVIRAGCTVGVVAGAASADGRPISFKNRDFEFAYQGVTYVSGGTYRYIGIGNSGSTPLMGLNEKGVGLGNSVMSDLNGGGGNVTCMDWLLKNCATVDECRTALRNDTYAGARPTFSLPLIGMNGGAFHIEKGANYYEYDPLDCGPDKVRKYPVIVRTNNGHMNTDGADDPTTGGKRYYEARDHLHNAVIRNGIFDTDPLESSGVTIAEVIQMLRRGNPGYEGGWTDPTSGNCNSTSLGTMIAHGINQGEDSRIAVMWSALYKADYVAFVPLWVDLGIAGEIPGRCSLGNDVQGLSFQAHRIYIAKDPDDYDQYVNDRLIPMETNMIQAVSDARERWFARGYIYDEAKRISVESVETVYWTIRTLADQAQTSPRNLNQTPLITAITAQGQGNTVLFSHDATDPDGSIQTVHWEFGDGQTGVGDGPSHTYTSPGTYLVLCRVSDNSGSRNARWKYVDVGPAAVASTGSPALRRLGILSCASAGGAVTFTVQLEKTGRYVLSVYNLKGQQVWRYNGAGQGDAALNVHWHRGNRSAGAEVYVARLTQDNNRAVGKFTLAH